MKKLILYFALWFILADITNYTNSKILLAVSSVVSVLFIVWIVKTYGNANTDE